MKYKRKAALDLDLTSMQNDQNSHPPEHYDFVSWTPEKNFCTDPTDVSLIVDQYVFRVHKEILKASSDYFQAMFSSGMQENEKDQISLQLIGHEPFLTLVQGFYSGKLDLKENNVFEITEAAHILQLTPALFIQCTDFLRQLINVESCFETMYFCDSINLVDVYADARRFCLANFDLLRHSQSFLKLTQLQLFDYISDKYLVVNEEMHVVEAIREWLMKSKMTDLKFSFDMVKKLVASSICLKNGKRDLDQVTSMILSETREMVEEEILNVLGKRERLEDVFMFWSLLNTTTADGLVDIVKLCQDSGQGIKVGSMTDIVERPGYDLGSAFCVQGCYVYLSGGGPSFGKVNWIRKLYRYDLSKTLSAWETIGDLYETRRHHAMVAVGSKLYIFGGFGKFRTKNLKLDCFDTLSGTWEALPVTPTHEIKPVATSDQHRIFYMDRAHTVHSFDTTSGNWSSMTPSLPARVSAPVAIFAVAEEPGLLMAVMDGPNLFTFVTLHEGKGLASEECKQDFCEIKKSGKYEGSVLANGKVFILVGNDDVEDADTWGPGDFDPVRKLVTYCTRTKTVVRSVETNVKKALAMMAVPYLPSTYTTGSFRSEAMVDNKCS